MSDNDTIYNVDRILKQMTKLQQKYFYYLHSMPKMQTQCIYIFEGSMYFQSWVDKNLDV